jgi:hypothetical protein
LLSGRVQKMVTPGERNTIQDERAIAEHLEVGQFEKSTDIGAEAGDHFAQIIWGLKSVPFTLKAAPFKLGHHPEAARALWLRGVMLIFQ